MCRKLVSFSGVVY